MSRVPVLVGTKKGAFVLEADGKPDRWDVSGPFFGGWEIFHLSHDHPDEPLPAPVAAGDEPLMVVGAIAGG
jgi:hypothetical protein